MEHVKFLAVPTRPLSDRQVDWEPQSLSEWLQQLSGSALDKTCEKICVALQHLNRAPLDGALLKQLLDEFATYLKLYETRIDSLYLESPAMLPEYEQHCVEWLVWSYLSLSDGFFRAAEALPEKGAKALCLYRCLWALSRAYLHVAGVYCSPPDDFWKLLNRGYAAAEQQALSDMPLADDQQQAVSVGQLYKLVLIFELCDLRQYRPREMRKVFEFLSRFSHGLELRSGLDERDDKGLYVINLREDMPPLRLSKRPELKGHSSSRYFAPSPLAKNIFQALQQDRSTGGALATINKSLLTRVIKTLGQAQFRRFQRNADERRFRGIIGFANIRDYLHKEPEKPAAKKPPVPRPGKPYEYDTSKFEIVAEGDEVVFQLGDNVRKKFGNNERIDKIIAASGGLSGEINVWDTKEFGKRATDIDINEFVVLNSSAKGYGVAVNSHQARVKVGELFAIVEGAPTAGLELAIIRHIRRLFGDQLYLGVELIGIAKELVIMQGAGNREKLTNTIFLPAIKALGQPDSVIYSSPEFNAGEFVTVKRGKQEVRCRLNKLLNSTSSLTHAELFYPKMDE